MLKANKPVAPKNHIHEKTNISTCIGSTDASVFGEGRELLRLLMKSLPGPDFSLDMLLFCAVLVKTLSVL
jgi:hypothetical protein